MQKLWRWSAVIAWMAAIFIFSSRQNLPEPHRAVWELLLYNGAHFAEYAVVGALLVLALSAHRSIPRRSAYLAAFLLATLYGLGDEIHQAFVPTRTCDVRDLLVDAAGAGGAVLATLAWRRRGRRAGEPARPQVSV